jgi:hypothetical protein
VSTTRFASAVMVILLVGAANAGADEIWNEFNDGPISNVGVAPTLVTLVSASDVVVGDGSPGGKFFTFSIPVGETVSSILVDPGTGGIMTGSLWFLAAANGIADCGSYTITAPVEMLDGSNCASSLPVGGFYQYTVGLSVLGSSPWTATITSTVPVELQTFSVE